MIIEQDKTGDIDNVSINMTSRDCLVIKRFMEDKTRDIDFVDASVYDFIILGDVVPYDELGE